MTEKRICYFCKGNEPKKDIFSKGLWIEERQFLGAYGRILKEVIIGGGESQESDRQPIKTVFYCSWACSEKQADQEEKELWNKGNCKECNNPLAVINDECENLEHKRLGCLLPIKNTPDCLKNK